MGGERASTTRARERGLICCLCGALLCTQEQALEQRLPRGERRCDLCDPNAPRHRVLMQFMHRPEGWAVSFLEADCRTALRRKLRFTDDAKILEMAERGGADFTSAAKADMQHGIRNGRGGIWLYLTKGQYRRLK